MTEQVSPDGQWKWDGSQWVPNTYVYGDQPPVVAATRPPAPVGDHDWKAIASLVCAVAAVLTYVSAIPAVVFGHLSRSEARREGRQPSGMALAGLIIGYVFIALGAAALLLVLLIVAAFSRG